MELCYIEKLRGLGTAFGCDSFSVNPAPKESKVEEVIERYLREKKIAPSDAEIKITDFSSRCNKRGNGGRVRGKFIVVKDGMKIGRGSLRGELLCTAASQKLISLTASVYPYKRPRKL